MKKIILTGDRPTGRLHIGHYVGSLSERVHLQNTGAFDEIYFMIADAQALTDNAENPEKGFRPSPGTITDLHLPGGKGIRVDSAIYSGCSISPYYDSMVAKLIVWAKNRDEAIQKMQSALGEVIIEGIDTNVDYLYELLNNPVYQSGEFNVNFIDTIKH